MELRQITGKKAQGFSFSTFLGIILGVIALVLLVVGLMGGFDKLLGWFNLLPGTKLQVLASSCQGLVTANQQGGDYINLQFDFCSFKDVKLDTGEVIKANCKYEPIKSTLGDTELKCNDDAGLIFCNQSAMNAGDRFKLVKVNEDTCKLSDDKEKVLFNGNEIGVLIKTSAP